MIARRTIGLAVAIGLLAPAISAQEAKTPDAQAPAGLVAAYKKEYAFLEAEKRALQKRIAIVQADATRKLDGARSDIAQLQRKVLDLKGQADQLEIDLEEAERAAVSADEDADKLDDTLDRAAESLAREGLDVPERPEAPEAQAAWIRQVFTLAAGSIRDNGQLKRENGRFFLSDGTQVEGELYHLGRVASFGVADEGAGPLAPAGAGKLKLWPGQGQASAQALAANRLPDPLQVFLYESLDKAVEPKQAKTAMEIIDSGGVIGWVIVALGILAALMVLARIAILIRAGWGTERLVHRLVELVGAGKRDEAKAACAASSTAAARVLDNTVAHLDRDRNQLEDLVAESILQRQPGIERFGSAITVFAAVAPLLGLLGTVTGIISTFDVITEFGTGDPKLLSGGISEALVTTELGLMVAIPALLVGTLLAGRAQGILTSIERAALAVINAAKADEEAAGPADDVKGDEAGAGKETAEGRKVLTSGAGTMGGVA